MSVNSTLETIEALEAIINLAVTAGVNFKKLAEMREENGGLPLTTAQRLILAEDAQSAIDKL